MPTHWHFQTIYFAVKLRYDSNIDGLIRFESTQALQSEHLDSQLSSNVFITVGFI